MNGLIEPPSPRVRPDESGSGLRQTPLTVSDMVRTRSPILGDEWLWLGEGESRCVTLLFSDMCRSLEATRDLDPEDAAAFINRLLVVMVDVILEYEGSIDRFQGDGALAVFGLMGTHEKDPERAIRAAIEIRARARCLDLDVTAGINTGDVYVGPVGSELYRETMVVGPVVGLAARLQALAEPGQILVGQMTQRLAQHAFKFTPLTLGVKGLARPMVGYVVE